MNDLKMTPLSQNDIDSIGNECIRTVVDNKETLGVDDYVEYVRRFKKTFEKNAQRFYPIKKDFA